MVCEQSDAATCQVHAQSRQQGFTLIEVIVATTILAMAIYLALSAYAFFGETWRKGRLSDTRSLDLYRNHILCRSAVESICDYYVTDTTNEKNRIHYLYFIGLGQSFDFVTLSSVFVKGVPAAARIHLIKTESGGQNLVYEEAPLLNRYIRYEDQVPEYEHLITLYENVEDFGIRYYGVWEFRFNEAIQDTEKVYRWQPDYFGKVKKELPELIELSLSGIMGELTLTLPVKASNLYKGSTFMPEVQGSP